MGEPCFKDMIYCVEGLFIDITPKSRFGREGPSKWHTFQEFWRLVIYYTVGQLYAYDVICLQCHFVLYYTILCNTTSRWFFTPHGPFFLGWLMVCLMQHTVQRMMCFKQKIVELGKGTEHIYQYIFTYTHIANSYKILCIYIYIYIFKGDFVSRFPDILY